MSCLMRNEPTSDSDSNNERWFEEAGPAVYFAQIGELASLTETEVSKKGNNERNNNTRISLERIKDEALTETTPIEKLPTPIKVSQEREIEERFEMLKMNNELEEEQVRQVKAVLKQGQDVFAQSVLKLGCTDVVEHVIDTGEAAPIKQNVYRTAPDIREFIQKEIAHLEE
ncbi:13202_t:CDS:2 [Acaulospora morrowiae]|uniref:13202_t:CDS:1 n=1 Tax=Acaulospora morrowiae TaxID=94023 RepID=A0A9N9H8E4_9GLOM|nr:13202_t:CDS:2 [Acaulospora morrowiae]